MARVGRQPPRGFTSSTEGLVDVPLAETRPEDVFLAAHRGDDFAISAPPSWSLGTDIAHYTIGYLYTDRPVYRPGMIGAWLVGFLFYEWLAQTQGLGFWTAFFGRLHPLPMQIGASLPSFALAFGLASLVGLFGRRAAA